MWQWLIPLVLIVAGVLIYNSIKQTDYPVIQGAIMLIAGVYVFVNLVVDLIYLSIDPRVRY